MRAAVLLSVALALAACAARHPSGFDVDAVPSEMTHDNASWRAHRLLQDIETATVTLRGWGGAWLATVLPARKEVP